MPPAARKRKSDEMDNGPSTPTQSPRKKMRITQAQKQALIDNLQLEVSERARQLRAQYALQCQDLKSRIERRINRVPTAMRKMKMGDLIAQEQARATSPAKQPTLLRSPAKPQFQERPLPAPPSPSKLPSPARQPIIQSQKSRKRKSSAILIPSDKENEPDTSNTGLDSIAVQKNAKRVKTATAAATGPKRAPSRTQKKAVTAKDVPNGVLSPRSHNSRALPRSPIKDKELPSMPGPAPGSPSRNTQNIPPAPASPSRQIQNIPQSPSKLQSPFKLAANAGFSAISAFAKKGYAGAAARLTRPVSPEKDMSGTGIPIPASPSSKMLPPPRPALTTLVGSSTTSIPNLSPQRTASQASLRSVASAQSATSSTNATVITKPTRAGTIKKAVKASAKTVTSTKTTAASRTKQKIVVSGSTVSTNATSPRATGMKRAPTAAATSASTAAAKKVASAAAARKAAATPAPSGRVLRKRN